MKTAFSSKSKLRGLRAFTLIEALVASMTLVIVVGSVIMCNLFGLSMAVRQQIWLGASDDSAQAISTLNGDIRAAVTLKVGNFTGNTFVQTTQTNTQQAGNALLIYTNSTATYATGPWTLYYYNVATNVYGLNSNSLIRSNYFDTGAGDFKEVSANPITNDMTHPIFTELDCTDTGTPLNNSVGLAPISIYLSFTKLQDPEIKIQSGSVVDLYQIVTIVTPRAVLTQ